MNMRRSAGFSIMEIMVVLFIIGLILSMVGPRIVKLMSSGNETATKATLTAVKNAALEYQMDMGNLPKTLEHLVKNVDSNPKWRGPYMEGQTEVPTDKWGNGLVYNIPPKVFTDKYKSFEVFSYGEKGEGAEQSEYLLQGS
jgi:general secretion pathway protein G